ncbi:MAG: FKBP-type peptidyl-prolyl cis-trans isomerase [Gammaproteobacteria bacterium]|nr:FKBP-type peptidyl-prolyl cis-trans isomerase [Gammaproteobacteria bacterium]
MTSQINSNSRVLADITIKLKDGSVADSTKVNGKPSWIILGNGSFSDEFENRMIGAKVGDELTFELPAKDAFGEANPDNIHFMDISQFPQDIELNSGAIISFEQAGGGAIPGIIRDVKDSSVTVDFNHPLAGKTVVFEIAVLQIEE